MALFLLTKIWKKKKNNVSVGDDEWRYYWGARVIIVDEKSDDERWEPLNNYINIDVDVERLSLFIVALFIHNNHPRSPMMLLSVITDVVCYQPWRILKLLFLSFIFVFILEKPT